MKKPPAVFDLEKADWQTLVRHCKYIQSVLRRLPETDDRVRWGKAWMKSTRRAHPLLDDLRRAIHRVEAEVIIPVLDVCPVEGLEAEWFVHRLTVV